MTAKKGINPVSDLEAGGNTTQNASNNGNFPVDGNVIGNVNEWVEDIKKRLVERHFNIDTQFEAEIPLIYFNGHKAMSLGNFSVITGKQKAGKGFSLSLMVNGFLNGDPQRDVIGAGPIDRKRVVYIDTEQAGGHAKRLVNVVKKLNGNEDCIDGFWLRGFSPKEIVISVDEIIKMYSDKACYFIIDGIRDLSSKGINDQEESTMIFVKLLDWTQHYNIHITVVIHQNKADTNATGYLGGDMVKKGELTLAVSKDKKTLTHTIDPEDTRDAPLEPLYFMINPTVTPLFIDPPKQKGKQDMPEDKEDTTHRAVITAVFKDGKALTAGEFIDKIKYEFRVGTAKAKIFKEYYLDRKYIKDAGHGAKRSFIPYEENELQF